MDVIAISTEDEMQVYLTAYGRTIRPDTPYNLLFPDTLTRQAATHLQANGRKRLEQLVLWGGYATPTGIVLASLFLPETEATWGWVCVLPEEQSKIAEWLHSHGQLLFVEAHTHGAGPRATELSDEDRRHPAGRRNGFLTLIVPDYARHGIDFSQAGVCECHDMSWSRLSLEQTRSRLQPVSESEARHALGILG